MRNVGSRPPPGPSRVLAKKEGSAQPAPGRRRRNHRERRSVRTNPDNGHTGTVTPVRTYQASSGGDCREYETTVTVGGKLERGYGTACRQSDGSWHVAN
ncbi:MAG: hypothetical protein DME14_15865 [Candidatus Rokuibacteriota bacterium]|nr:MAG: hypothetical protein DME14_15865 [Candidatus Rokubacteria bacterium]